MTRSPRAVHRDAGPSHRRGAAIHAFTALALLGLLGACSGGDAGELPEPIPGAGASSAGSSSMAGANSSGGGSVTAGNGAGGSSPIGGGAGSSGAAGAPGVAGAAGAPPLPGSCAEASAPYTIEKTALDPSLVLPTSSGGNNRSSLQLPVAADSAGQTYVALTRSQAGSMESVVAAVPGAFTSAVSGAVTGGVTATKDGFAVLLFDPNAVNARTWAAVRRVRADGTQVYQTDLFRSPNLTAQDTKGAPEGGRLGYLPASDQVVVYFGHTQMYDDGVRHQGGYLATLDPSGVQSVQNGWFGSHNLDRRLLVDDTGGAVLGLGDAYPEGIFFSYLGSRPRTAVLYPLAAAGNGATNGQLGGMVDLGTEIVIPFVTNRSIPQDLDAGTWPDIDEAISQQIRDAAANGTDLGVLRLPKSGMNPSAPLTATWLDVARAEGARFERLKAARYGSGNLVLLGWAEATGASRNATFQYFTTIIDPSGAVCQPKTPLPADVAFTAADDIVRRADGSIVWAAPTASGIQLVTLRPR